MDDIIMSYDIEADSLLIILKQADFFETVQITDNLIIDIGENGELVTVEVLNLSHILKQPIEEFYEIFLNGSGVNFILEPTDDIPWDGDVEWLKKLSIGTYQRNE